MKKKFIKLSMLTACAVLSAGLIACGGEGETLTGSIPANEQLQSAENVAFVNTEGKVQSDLNGSWVDPETNNKRPIALMINNIGEAMPQSGIGQADIVYEMIVEGGITRLMAVFSDYDGLEKIGPVRSARQYYCRSAQQLDAVFCHIGTSTLADAQLANSGQDHVDGMYSANLLYRDNSRVAPHNAYTSGERLDQIFADYGFQREHGSGYAKMFQFNMKDTDLAEGNSATRIETAFSAQRKPWFEYNADEKVYYRFQYGDKQIDDVTGEQLSYKNVLVLYATTYSVDSYLMEVCNDRNGSGYYATNGKYIEINWKAEEGTIHYYTTDGQRLKINPGKTWITFFDETNVSGVTME